MDGTDPNLALKTRRGTVYFKVPSPKGVWYRSMFEHNGSVASLEDWFDARRLRKRLRADRVQRLWLVPSKGVSSGSACPRMTKLL
jgi:hypothetical protein